MLLEYCHMRSSLIFACLLLGLCTTCKNAAIEQEEKPPHWFAKYYVRYLQTERQLKAHASFLEGDSIKNAEPKRFRGGVSFQGKKMQFRDLQGKLYRYLLNEQTDYNETFLFRHRDDNGDYWEYTMRMHPIEDFFVKDKISKSKGMTIVADGAILQSNESLVLLFSDERNRATTLTIEGPSKTIELSIPPEQLGDLSVGKGKLYLVKKQFNEDQEEQLNASSSIEFYTKSIDIEVLE